MSVVDRTMEPRAEDRSSDNLRLATFVAAIFASAALLFAVQPMFTKMVLPRLGGSAAVWIGRRSCSSSDAAGGLCLCPSADALCAAASVAVIHIAVMVAAGAGAPAAYCCADGDVRRRRAKHSG